MCGRFTQNYTWQEVFDYYNLTGPAINLQPNWNVAPTQTIHTCISTNDGLSLQYARWGLVPGWWKKSLKELPSTINARSETVAEKPMFRSAFKARRCLIPAGGFYEWQRAGDTKQPYFIAREDGLPLTFAGIWETWKNPENGEAIVSTTILTTAANAFMQTIHHRMPVFLEAHEFQPWLKGGNADLPSDGKEAALVCHPVSKAVGNVRNNGPDLIEPNTTQLLL